MVIVRYDRWLSSKVVWLTSYILPFASGRTQNQYTGTGMDDSPADASRYGATRLRIDSIANKIDHTPAAVHSVATVSPCKTCSDGLHSYGMYSHGLYSYDDGKPLHACTNVLHAGVHARARV